MSQFFLFAQTRISTLPSGCSETEKATVIKILDNDCVAYSPTSNILTMDNSPGNVRSNNPIPKALGYYYFEVTIRTTGKLGFIAVGLSTQNASLNRILGWSEGSFSIHIDDGKAYAQHGTGRKIVDSIEEGETIGILVDYFNNKVFLTRNGCIASLLFDGESLTEFLKNDVYPTIGFRSEGEELSWNFGLKNEKPFVFDFDRFIADHIDSLCLSVDKFNIKISPLKFYADKRGLENTSRLVAASVPRLIVEEYLKKRGCSDTYLKLTQSNFELTPKNSTILQILDLFLQGKREDAQEILLQQLSSEQLETIPDELTTLLTVPDDQLADKAQEISSKLNTSNEEDSMLYNLQTQLKCIFQAMYWTSLTGALFYEMAFILPK